MIVKRVWVKRNHFSTYYYEGWFLLGFIPLYIRSKIID